MLYDTFNQKVLLAFRRIACLSISQEFVYCQSLLSQIQLPVKFDFSNPTGQLSNVTFKMRMILPPSLPPSFRPPSFLLPSIPLFSFPPPSFFPPSLPLPSSLPPSPSPSLLFPPHSLFTRCWSWKDVSSQEWLISTYWKPE